MYSKEMGLVLVQKIFSLNDLHYGFWEDDSKVSIGGFFAAQEKYSDVLFNKIEELVSFNKDAKILDVGCGVGENIRKLCNKGYYVDGLVPSKWMIEQCMEKTKFSVHECNFEDFKNLDTKTKYDLVFFSESFQYVDMSKSFEVLNEILNSSGKVVIFDFFKRDNIEGLSPLGGGHSIGEFYKIIKSKSYTIISDDDYTKNMSPNLTLVNEILTERLIPSAQVIDEFLLNKNSILYKFMKFYFRKKLKKIKYKYSKNRNAENFEKYKIYKLTSLEKTKD